MPPQMKASTFLVLLWVGFLKFKLQNVKTAKCLLEENSVLVKELYSRLPSHQIHPFSAKLIVL